jgi:hypothetical protein
MGTFAATTVSVPRARVDTIDRRTIEWKEQDAFGVPPPHK